ncbi:DUF6308 family protein [Dactylosporangium sp. NPDC049525]|uniref:DUF6308 family protein n=1 Tax=Dactylosporangium sp. NPDC049525 TaxID=3154730 RepID=UPI00344AD23D
MTGKRVINLATLLQVLDAPQSKLDLQRYFAAGPRPGDAPPFTGSRFERLAGGGDRAASWDVITADDLVAVEMLNVRVPARVALHLLEGELGNTITRELREIPVDAVLGTEKSAARVAVNSPASNAWHLLKNCDDVGWVTAGKLLARKRPRLIPVYDRVVRCAYGAPKGFWLWLDGMLQKRDGVLAQRLATLREAAGLPDEISALRVLDVTIWMRHRKRHSEDRCPGISADLD